MKIHTPAIIAMLLLTTGCVAMKDVLYVDGGHGTVVDGESGEPIQGVLVYSNKKYETDTTGENGEFYLKGLSKRKLTIIFPADHIISNPLTLEHPDYDPWTYDDVGGFGNPYRTPYVRKWGTVRLYKKEPNQNMEPMLKTSAE